MNSLAEDLTLSDLNDRVTATKTYIENVKKYAYAMRAFLPIFNNSARLPIMHEAYNGKIAYVSWVIRLDELYLNLNVTYHATGRFKCAQTLSQLLTLTELTDRRNIRTLDGRRFKQYYTYNLVELAHVVVSDRIISPKSFAIIENGLERFVSRDKILRRFDVQSPLVGYNGGLLHGSLQKV